ncbi:hypothetical protein VB773_20300 [Haloarculaceae archaeon H-GB2-1]|nr:hypothetical protein [Haloarculaceae archaeon H-GB1-1]MEA5409685.1 hypothetical protein [Haloarculaceae archaeon H-GB2-1]
MDDELRVTEKCPAYTLYRFAEEIPDETSQDAAFDPVKSEASDGTESPKTGSKMSDCS